jgi:hypothetical protein
MNTIKAKTTIQCETCGCSLARSKSFKVVADNATDAKAEVAQKTATWKQSLAGTNCKVCQSIINDLKAA